MGCRRLLHKGHPISPRTAWMPLICADRRAPDTADDLCLLASLSKTLDYSRITYLDYRPKLLDILLSMTLKVALFQPRNSKHMTAAVLPELRHSYEGNKETQIMPLSCVLTPMVNPSVGLSMLFS